MKSGYVERSSTMRPCNSPGCKYPHKAGGYCSGCYKRLKRAGVEIPTRAIRPKGLSIDGLLRHVGWTEVSHDWTPVETPCWEWNGRRDRQGYGQTWFGGRNRKVPKLAYEGWCGEVAPGLVVRHRCDNPPCLNPDHLLLGTPADNARDKVERGRTVNLHGEDSPCAIRTAAEIQEIRALHAQGWSYRRLARHFSLDIGYVGRIIRREIWRSVA